MNSLTSGIAVASKLISEALVLVSFCVSITPFSHAPIPVQDNIVEVEVSVDPKYHRHFIQRRGQVRVVGLVRVRSMAYVSTSALDSRTDLHCTVSSTRYVYISIYRMWVHNSINHTK